MEAETTLVLCCGLHAVDDRARASAQATLGDRGRMTHDSGCFGRDGLGQPPGLDVPDSSINQHDAGTGCTIPIPRQRARAEQIKCISSSGSSLPILQPTGRVGRVFGAKGAALDRIQTASCQSAARDSIGGKIA